MIISVVAIVAIIVAIGIWIFNQPNPEPDLVPDAIKIDLIEFKVKKDIPYLTGTDIYFKIYIDDSSTIYAPKKGDKWHVTKSEPSVNPNWDYTYNVDNRFDEHTIKIEMYESPYLGADRPLDINEKGNENDLSLWYNIRTGGWKRWDERGYHYGRVTAGGDDASIVFDISMVWF
jgi:hypothetical protein